MTEPINKYKLKKHFEKNLLDGVNVEDCGDGKLLAKYVWEYFDVLFCFLQSSQLECKHCGELKVTPTVCDECGSNLYVCHDPAITHPHAMVGMTDQEVDEFIAWEKKPKEAHDLAVAKKITETDKCDS